MQSLQLSPQDAAKELLRRRAARKDLIRFTEFTLPKYAFRTALATVRNAWDGKGVERVEITKEIHHGDKFLANFRSELAKA